MGGVKNRIDRRKSAIKELNELVKKSDTLLIIHYSCESFYNIKDGRTPRITSIAVRYYKTGQTKSFSIHKIAEKSSVNLNDIEKQYDQLEKEMLDEFFDFMNLHRSYNWIHWNMRDINYGFEAINHRYSVLKGKPVEIHDNNKFDLARRIVDIYGNYINDHPRFEKLIEKNNITKKDFLSGGEEAVAFDQKEFVKLHQSTLRKVDILSIIVERIIDNNLKTDAGFKEKYGVSPQGIFELIKDNWILSSILSLLGLILGGFISFYITTLLS